MYEDKKLEYNSVKSTWYWKESEIKFPGDEMVKKWGAQALVIWY
jgi:hypothetical protein